MANGQRVRAEVRLTAALLRFARHLACSPHALAGPLLEGQPTLRSYVRLVWAWQRLLAPGTAAARMALPVACNPERLR